MSAPNAIDLSWKLAGTVAGWADPGVLDSHEPERRAVGWRNVDAVGWAAEGMMLWRAHGGPEITANSPARDLWLRDGRAMQDALGPEYNFVDLTGTADATALQAAFAATGAPLQILSIDDPHAAQVYEASLLLLRPDLHVYWRGDQLPEDLMALALAATGHRGRFGAADAHPAQGAAVAR